MEKLQISTEFNVEQIAQICHEANKSFCESIGDNTQLSWYEAPDWQKQSAITGVKFHLENENTTPADSHNSWLKEKELDGWKYGETKNVEKKEHPCFVSYEELSVEQQMKDYIFSSIVKGFKQQYLTQNKMLVSEFAAQAVGLDFNPSNGSQIDRVKLKCAELIDELDYLKPTLSVQNSWTKNVFRTQAFNLIVSAQMAIVKFITFKH